MNSIILAFIITLAMQQIVRGMVMVCADAMPISNLGDFKVIGQSYLNPISGSVIILEFHRCF